MTLAIDRVGDSAVRAIGKSFDQHARASAEVVRAFRPADSSATVQFSQESRDLASAFADMTKAETSGAAQGAVLRTVDEMAGELTNILGDDRPPA